MSTAFYHHEWILNSSIINGIHIQSSTCCLVIVQSNKHKTISMNTQKTPCVLDTSCTVHKGFTWQTITRQMRIAIHSSVICVVNRFTKIHSPQMLKPNSWFFASSNLLYHNADWWTVFEADDFVCFERRHIVNSSESWGNGFMNLMRKNSLFMMNTHVTM